MIGIARIAFCIGFMLIGDLSARAQWSAYGRLLNLTFVNDCSITSRQVAVARTDSIFYCPAQASAVDAQIQDASHFYLVHEYGLLAIRTNSHRLADCWAAHQLSVAPNGPHYVRRWIEHWRLFGSNSRLYGTREERIANVVSCCACGL